MLKNVISRTSKTRILDKFCEGRKECRGCPLETTEYCQAGDRRGHAIDAAYSVFLAKAVDAKGRIIKNERHHN